MRILITGGLGFIGANLIKKAQAAGYSDITVLDNCSVGKPEYIDSSHARLVRADLDDQAVLDELISSNDVVVHLAADTTVIGSINNPAYNFETNVVSTFRILEAMRKHSKTRMLFASTGGAITGDMPPPLHEDMPARPLSPYGASKLAAEGYLSAYNGSFQMNNCAFRFSNVFGPGSFHKGSVVAAYFKAIINEEPLLVYGDGEQTRDFVYVDDLCDVLVSAFERDDAGVFQLGSGAPTTINELIEKIRNTVGADSMTPVEYLAKRAGEVDKTYCDINKARNEIAYNPTTSLDAGLRVTWHWFQSKKVEFLAA